MNIAKLIVGFGLILLTTGCAGPVVKESESHMATEDPSIQAWFDDWIRATTEGDLELARGLIDDDAVFIIPNYGPMNKEDFAAAATASDPNIEFDLDSKIEEYRVNGDTAWVLSASTMGMTTKATGKRAEYSGYSLSILERRADDAWVVIRDINTVLPTPGE